MSKIATFKKTTRRRRRRRILPKDEFGVIIFFKRLLIGLVGMLTYPRFAWSNKLKISGMEYLKDLPDTNVLFLSNHQTYFADVMAFYHIFSAQKWGYKNNIRNPFYLLMPRAKVYYVAAEETMKQGGLLPRIFAYAGAVTVQRSWRAKGENVSREVDASANDKIELALNQGWVISFPQGTTSPYAPVRKGTAHIIKHTNPIVVPVVIDGFRRAFDKKGLYLKKRGTHLKVKFKEPIFFEEHQTVDEIIIRVREAIEQDADRLKFKDFK